MQQPVNTADHVERAIKVCLLSESKASNKPQGIETVRRYQTLLDAVSVKTRAERARFLRVSRARVTQVLKRLETEVDGNQA